MRIHRRIAPVDTHHSQTTARTRVNEAWAVATAGPTVAIASVVGACALALGGIALLVAGHLERRRYRARPGC